MGGKMKGGAALGALGGVSMLTSMIPAEEGSGLGQGLDIVGGVGMGASMGAMMGMIGGPVGAGIGAAVGGVLGGLSPAMSILSDSAERAAKATEELRISAELASGALGRTEQDFLGIDIKKLEDIPLEAFGKKTEEEKSQLDQFKDSLIAARDDSEEVTTEGTRVKEISAMSNVEQFLSSSQFQNMISTAAMAGADKDQIKLMLEGYLDVADKEYFSDRVVKFIDSVIPDGASADEIAVRFINSLVGVSDVLNQKMSDELFYFTDEQRKYEDSRAGRQVDFGGQQNQDFSQIIGSLQTSFGQDYTTGSQELLSLMMQQYKTGDMTSEDFAQQIISGSATEGAPSALAGFLNEIRINGESILDADPEFLMQILDSLQQITNTTPDVTTLSEELKSFNENGRAAAESLISVLANSDLESLGEILADPDLNLDNLTVESLKEIESQLRNLPDVGEDLADFFGQLVDDGAEAGVALQAVKLLMTGTVSSTDLLRSKARDPIRFQIFYDEKVNPVNRTGYIAGGIRGAIEMPGISDLVSSATKSEGGGSSDTSAIEEAYDKQIEKQDQIIENIKKEREERQKLLDLEKKAFDFAMKEQDLKNQIAIARAEGRMADAAMLQSQLDNERASNKESEEERRRQEKEDKRIEDANKRKEALQEEKKAATDAAKGGSGEGMSDEEVERIRQRAEYLQQELKASLVEFGRDIENAILDDGISGFFDAKVIKDFRSEMIKLGVPVKVVDDYLDTVFDGFIRDTDLVTTKEFKKVEEGLKDMGFEAERLEDITTNAFAILQDDDATKTEKIDLLAQAFFDAGMDIEEAKQKAIDFYSEVGNSANVTSNIDKIADAWKRTGESAKRTALLQALANDVAAGNLSADVVAGRLSQIDIIAPPPMATGGYIAGPGTGTSDSIPTMLSNGEYVIRAASVAKYGLPFFDAVNRGILPGAARGGLMSRYPSVARGMRSGGYAYQGMASGGLVENGHSEYNINVSVAGTDASADDIANKVMQTLQRRDKMNRAGIRL